MKDDEQVSQEGVRLRRFLHRWIANYWGPRCPDFEPDCPCCKAWAAFDTLFQHFPPSPGESER